MMTQRAWLEGILSGAALPTPAAVRTTPLRIAAGWPAALAIVLIGGLQQALGHLNGDVSWFITFAEKVLGGARAYVDVSDPNPPAAFLLYMPAVLVARWTGLRVETATVLQFFLLVAGSLALIAAIARPMLTRDADATGFCATRRYGCCSSRPVLASRNANTRR